jgi:hypothetical protein
MPAGSYSPIRASRHGEQQTVVLNGILDHTGGQAHSTSVKPISDASC